MSAPDAATTEWQTRFLAAMATACDGTKAHTEGVMIRNRDWHKLIELAVEVRAVLAPSFTRVPLPEKHKAAMERLRWLLR